MFLWGERKDDGSLCLCPSLFLSHGKNKQTMNPTWRLLRNRSAYRSLHLCKECTEASAAKVNHLPPHWKLLWFFIIGYLAVWRWWLIQDGSVSRSVKSFLLLLRLWESGRFTYCVKLRVHNLLSRVSYSHNKLECHWQGTVVIIVWSTDISTSVLLGLVSTFKQ